MITSLTSNQMIAPNVWIDPRNGNNYFLTVQYPEAQIRTVQDLQGHSAARRGHRATYPARHGADIQQIQAPTEVDHYQIRRKLDIYVRPATKIWADRRCRAQSHCSSINPARYLRRGSWQCRPR